MIKPIYLAEVGGGIKGLEETLNMCLLFLSFLDPCQLGKCYNLLMIWKLREMIRIYLDHVKKQTGIMSPLLR